LTLTAISRWARRFKYLSREYENLEISEKTEPIKAVPTLAGNVAVKNIELETAAEMGHKPHNHLD
jgi:hypothetical protein